MVESVAVRSDSHRRYRSAIADRPAVAAAVTLFGAHQHAISLLGEVLGLKHGGLPMRLRRILTVVSPGGLRSATVYRDDRAETYHVTSHRDGSPPADLGPYTDRIEALAAAYEAAGIGLNGKDEGEGAAA